MKVKVLLSLFLLLALCLAVVPVMAVYDIGYIDALGHTYNAGTVNGNSLEISFAYAQYVRPTNEWFQPVNSVNIGGVVYYLNGYQNFYTLQSDIPKNTITLSAYQEGQNTFSIIPDTWGKTSTITVNFVYTPEPIPEGAYLTATVLSESLTGVYYEIKPMPYDGSTSFSYISVGSQPALGGFNSPYNNPVYSSSDATITYKLGYGDSATFWCYAMSGFDVQLISTTVTASLNEDDVFINQSVINETLQNMPNPINPNPTTNNNAFVSGAWSPVGRDAVISSAFADIVRNGGFVFSLPHMASPEELRAGLLNNTGNITAPLYDFIDSASGMVLFLPDILGNAVGTVLNGISETVSVIKNYIDYLFGLLDNCMDFFYVLLPVIYILIPDAVWWCFTALLCYFIIKWILILILGYDVVSAYLTESKGEDKK